MKPVCLVIPPSCFLLDERVFPPLGVLRVASALEAAGRRVEVLDLSGIDGWEDALADHARRTEATVFGVTATTPQMPAVAKIARGLRSWRPDARLILGGPHVTLVYAAIRKAWKDGKNWNCRADTAFSQLKDMFDVLVTGDGERAIMDAVRWPRGPGRPVLIDADDPKGPYFLQGDEPPMPARHLIDMASYRYQIDGDPAASMIAQLGCPFACAFCGGRYSPSLRRVRIRSTESVIAEMRRLYQVYGYKAVQLYDDELNVNKQVVELMRAVAVLGKELGFRWKLRGFVKAELFTDEQAEAMASAGFRQLLVGFESGSPRILENINKKATVEDNIRCVMTAKKHGIGVKALMSLGHPGESHKTVGETRAWLMGMAVDDFDVTVITTYPGTPYYDAVVETAPGVWTYTARSGDRLHARDVDWMEEAAYYKGKPGGYESFVWTDHLSAQEIVRLRDGLEEDVRAVLGIPFNAAAPGKRYEASMGQLPGHLLRRSQ